MMRKKLKKAKGTKKIAQKATARATKKQRVHFSGDTSAGEKPVAESSREERLREQCAALGVLAKAINASRDRAARRDQAAEAVYEYAEIGTVRCGEKATSALRDLLDERG